MAIVLGIDPGSRYLGYGLLRIEKNTGIQYLSSGVLNLSKEDDFFHRLKLISEFIQKLVSEEKPDFLAIEGLIHVKNVNSLAKLAQARGAIIGAASSLMPEKRVYEFSPNLIKSTLSGHGHADKDSIQKALSWFIDVPSYIRDDESDALAIAFCFIAHYSGVPLRKKVIPNQQRSI